MDDNDWRAARAVLSVGGIWICPYKQRLGPGGRDDKELEEAAGDATAAITERVKSLQKDHMNQDDTARRVTACLASLFVAVDAAGGNAAAVCGPDRLADTSALQFIARVLGPNDIRFVYTGQRKGGS